MKIIKLLVIAIILTGTQGCANTATKKNADSMRIWISPAYRSDVKVDQNGYMYVAVKR